MAKFNNKLTIDDFHIGEFVLDTYNEFCKKDFEFTEGQSYNPDLAHCEIVDKTISSICVRVRKFPFRIIKHNGALTNPIECTNWFKFVREHEDEITFSFRFKKL